MHKLIISRFQKVLFLFLPECLSSLRQGKRATQTCLSDKSVLTWPESPVIKSLPALMTELKLTLERSHKRRPACSELCAWRTSRFRALLERVAGSANCAECREIMNIAADGCVRFCRRVSFLSHIYTVLFWDIALHVDCALSFPLFPRQVFRGDNLLKLLFTHFV